VIALPVIGCLAVVRRLTFIFVIFIIKTTFKSKVEQVNYEFLSLLCYIKNLTVSQPIIRNIQSLLLEQNVKLVLSKYIMIFC
jgi:hypothetical protein